MICKLVYGLDVCIIYYWDLEGLWGVSGFYLVFIFNYLVFKVGFVGVNFGYKVKNNCVSVF